MNQKVEKQDNSTNEIVGWIKHLILAIVISVLINAIMKPTVVFGESMFPTLNAGDYLLVNRLAYEFDTPKRGDIVMFKSRFADERYLIKRVIGIGGDKVEIINGEVYLNGQILTEPYLSNRSMSDNLAVVVPENTVFVLGDNRENSLDSRSPVVGFVENKRILGKVWISIFPLKTLY